MKISKRFRDAIEKEPADLPDYVWLEYAVCALGSAPCGWAGWIIGAAFKKAEQRHATSTGDKTLPSDDSQICPSCRAMHDGCGTLFRTGCARRYDLSLQQDTPLKPDVNYEVDDIEYV
jgi:hypothetical protein